MSSYRFCRTDDMALLVHAYGRAYAPHFTPPPQLDREQLKVWIRELDLWCSSCAVALDETREPIGVVLGCKRPTETLLLAVGVHPEHTRRGHGRHLLTSLSSKLAILGPPRLLAEVPADDARATAFFESCGYTAEVDFTDWALAAGLPAHDLPGVAEIDLDGLIAAGAFDASVPRPWMRAVESLQKLKGVLQGRALASPDRIEGWVLWRDGDGCRTIMALGGDHAGLILRHVADAPLALPRFSATEIGADALRALGLTPGRTWRRYTAQATPA